MWDSPAQRSTHPKSTAHLKCQSTSVGKLWKEDPQIRSISGSRLPTA